MHKTSNIISVKYQFCLECCYDKIMETSSVCDSEQEIINLPHEEIEIALKNVIEKELGTNDYTFTLSCCTKKGDNFFGIVYRVTVVIANKCKKATFIVKVPPSSEARREKFFTRFCFTREAFVYEEILPIFEKFQLSKNVNPKTEGFYEYPRCYKNLTIDRKEAIFLEDMSPKGFIMHDRKLSVTFDHVALVMEALGKLHAISFAIKDQNFELLSPFTTIEDLFEVQSKDKSFTDWMNQTTAKIYSQYDKEKDKDVIAKIDKILENGFIPAIIECIRGSTAEPYAVICHGDCWNNNILYRKDSHHELTEICLLDFQIVRFASPVCDIAYYIFCCTTKELRQQYYEEFLRIYYKSLSNLLQKLGSDPDELFPYSALQDQLKQFGKFGLLMAIMVLPVFLAGDDMPDFDDIAEKATNGNIDLSKQSNFNGNTLENFYLRINDIIRDMERLEYI